MSIKQNVEQILSELPSGVLLVTAAKTMDAAAVIEAIEAGVKIIGENYIQETEKLYEAIGSKVQWHFIGHLQRNKVKKAVAIFDMIETVDSSEIAKEISKKCSLLKKVMPVLVEINSGHEEQKTGIFPEDAEWFIREISKLDNIKVVGLMTMGPSSGSSEEFRPYFIATREVFEKIKKLGLPHVEMKYLSMGMTNSYKVAVEEGANIVRIGSRIFGQRRVN